MKEKYLKYLNEDIKFDKTTMIGIFSLLIVITGIFGFLYEFIFYYFNGGMNTFYLSVNILLISDYLRITYIYLY